MRNRGYMGDHALHATSVIVHLPEAAIAASARWFAETVQPISGNFGARQAFIPEPSQENCHGPWNLVVDARGADSGHSAARDVLTSLSWPSVPPYGGTDG
jgi:hypothetical protein